MVNREDQVLGSRGRRAATPYQLARGVAGALTAFKQSKTNSTHICYLSVGSASPSTINFNGASNEFETFNHDRPHCADHIPCLRQNGAPRDQPARAGSNRGRGAWLSHARRCSAPVARGPQKQSFDPSRSGPPGCRRRINSHGNSRSSHGSQLPCPAIALASGLVAFAPTRPLIEQQGEPEARQVAPGPPGLCGTT